MHRVRGGNELDVRMVALLHKNMARYEFTISMAKLTRQAQMERRAVAQQQQAWEQARRTDNAKESGHATAGSAYATIEVCFRSVNEQARAACAAPAFSTPQDQQHAHQSAQGELAEPVWTTVLRQADEKYSESQCWLTWKHQAQPAADTESNRRIGEARRRHGARNEALVVVLRQEKVQPLPACNAG